MWAVITACTPASIAARNGAWCSARVASSKSIRGRPRCESPFVSPWPGKCLAQPITPVDCRPRTYAAVFRATTALSELAAHGNAILVCELLSDMGFTGAESIVRDVSARLDPVRWLILDLSRVGQLETVAVTLLAAYARQLAERGIQPVVADPRERGLLGDQVTEYRSLTEALRHGTHALAAGLTR